MAIETTWLLCQHLLAVKATWLSTDIQPMLGTGGHLPGLANLETPSYMWLAAQSNKTTTPTVVGSAVPWEQYPAGLEPQTVDLQC